MIPATANLNDVECGFLRSDYSEKEVTEYLRAWNAGPHFTQAVLYDGRIRNFDPEKSGWCYRHVAEKFGVKL